MVVRTGLALPELYVEDETAWLDAMAELIAVGAYDDLDFTNLREFLTDMARLDRREVESRLVVLAAHVLKWVHQPQQRSRSWQSTILEQRQELRRHAGRGVLRNHAEAALGEAYCDAVERAALDTGLPAATFPSECAYSLDELLAFEPESNA